MSWELIASFAERLSFLEEDMNVEEVYLRSTDLPRTAQSAEALLLGLYPPHHRPEGELEKSI